MIFLAFSRWGFLVPILTVLGGVVALFATQALNLPPVAAVPVFLLLAGVIAGGAVFLADRKIQEGWGHVAHDAQNDRPIVYEESSGSFRLIPFRWWVFILPAAGVVFAGLYLFDRHAAG